MSIPFIFGGAAVIKGNMLLFEIPSAIYVIALIAFLAGSGREIMKDVQDFEGDKEKGVKSFPSYIGTRKSNILAALFYIFAIVLSFFPFFINQYEIYYLNYYFLILILITDTMLLTTAFHLIFKKKPYLRFFRKFSLAAVFIGLLAFLVGAFIHT
jgi:geranylgeranylglycerol-phosphate geranylgeranyltransferase